MKRWQVIVLSVVAVVLLVTVGGNIFYQNFIVPKYLEPVMEKVRDYVNEDDVLGELYDQVERLYDDGTIDEDTYEKFIESYEEYIHNDEKYAREILEEKSEAEKNNSGTEKTSISARYASTKVGVETIQTNDDPNGGNSTKRYSEERSSDRIKAEDVVKAEKVLNEKEKEEQGKETQKEEKKRSAYSILQANMTSEEYELFVKIMRKLDDEILLSFVDSGSKALIDKAGLKEYMHSKLTDEEYKQIVNLGYKYVSLFIKK